MILVTGAAGKTGKAVIRALAARGAGAHAVVHRDAQVAEVRAAGAVSASVGALGDRAALIAAARGATAIYHICPNVSPHEIAFARTVIDAALAAQVPRLAFHSVLHPQIEAMPHHWDKMQVEALLFASGLSVTILQPTAYMQNILAGWPAIAATGRYRVPHPPESRISLVDLDDVGEAAAVVLTDDRHAGATYEIVGTPPLSQHEVAAALGAALGRRVEAEEETIAEWAARAAGLDGHQRDTLIRMFRYYADHGLVGSPNALRWLLGREPTSFAAVCRRAVAERARDPT